MALFIPDGVRIYEADLDNLIMFGRSNFTPSGLLVEAQAAPNMTVKVSAGELFHSSVRIAVGAVASLAIAAADGTNPRIDVVAIDSVGTIAVTTGTPGSTPKPPSLPAGRIMLAYVSVSAGALNIQGSNISDRRQTQSYKLVVGTLANRPAAASAGVTQYVVSDGVDGYTLYISNGAAWIQAAAGSTVATATMPNLVPNGEFGRRTVWGLAMPEVFADGNGYKETGTTTSIASNQVTVVTGGGFLTYPKSNPGDFWRDGRFSATFKAPGTAGDHKLYWHANTLGGSSSLEAGIYNGNFKIKKTVATVLTELATVAQAITLNTWYWIEIETQQQGTTGVPIIAKFYTTGGTTPGVTKASSTLLQTLVVNPGPGDTQIFAGDAVLYSGTNNTIWGGIAASPGGAYVETWLPESYGTPSGWHQGTLGGQAIGFEEATDAGPIGKQSALRAYIPATSRYISIYAPMSSDLVPSQSYALSSYHKTSGKTGAGYLMNIVMYSVDQAGGNLAALASYNDSGETVWTRKTATGSSASTARRLRTQFNIGDGSTSTGTVYFMLPQLEQGSAVTAWRNHPDDGAPIVWHFDNLEAFATTSTSPIEINSKWMAGSLYLPWAATLKVEIAAQIICSAAGVLIKIQGRVNGSGLIAGPFAFHSQVLNIGLPVMFTDTYTVAEGHQRIAALVETASGTITLEQNGRSRMMITATRGK